MLTAGLVAFTELGWTKLECLKLGYESAFAFYSNGNEFILGTLILRFVLEAN